MVKLILVLILAQNILCNNETRNAKWLSDLEEFDDILTEQDFDENNNSSLPRTPQAICDKWCKPLLSNSLEMITMVDRVFSDNPILQISFRLFETFRVNGTMRFCNDQSEVKKWARFNREIVSIWPAIMKWYKMALNVYLAAADPQSNLTYAEFTCVDRLLRDRLLAETPPKLQEAVGSYFSLVHGIKDHLIRDFFNHIKLDWNLKSCKIPDTIVPNTLGIKSIKTGALLVVNKFQKQMLPF